MVAASRRGHVCTCKRARPCVLGQVAVRVTCLCARHMADSSRAQRMRPACEQAGPPCRRRKLLRGERGRGPSADARARAAQTGWSTSRRRAATCARPRRACPGPCATHWMSWPRGPPRPPPPSRPPGAWRGCSRASSGGGCAARRRGRAPRERMERWMEILMGT